MGSCTLLLTCCTLLAISAVINCERSRIRSKKAFENYVQEHFWRIDPRYPSSWPAEAKVYPGVPPDATCLRFPVPAQSRFVCTISEVRNLCMAECEKGFYLNHNVVYMCQDGKWLNLYREEVDVPTYHCIRKSNDIDEEADLDFEV